MSLTEPVQTTAKTQSTPSSGFVLQRKCACGGSAGFSGECETCQSNKLLGKPLQRKLAISEPGDQYEQEADRIADQVMASSGSGAVTATPVQVQRFTGSPSGQPTEVPASVERVLASPGQPLEPGLREDMEARFGHDFSRVRVHTDSIAEQSSYEVNANAFTVGEHVVFGHGQYGPDSFSGGRLIAHELTHVVQQSKGTGSKASTRMSEGSVATKLLARQVACLHSGVMLQRQVTDPESGERTRHSRAERTERRSSSSFERLRRTQREVADSIQQISIALTSLVQGYRAAYTRGGVSSEGLRTSIFVTAVARWRSYEESTIREDSIDAEHLSEWVERVQNVLQSLRPLLPRLNDRNAAETLEFQRRMLLRRTERLGETAFIESGRRERTRRRREREEATSEDSGTSSRESAEGELDAGRVEEEATILYREFATPGIGLLTDARTEALADALAQRMRQEEYEVVFAVFDLLGDFSEDNVARLLVSRIEGELGQIAADPRGRRTLTRMNRSLVAGIVTEGDTVAAQRITRGGSACLDRFCPFISGAWL